MTFGIRSNLDSIATNFTYNLASFRKKWLKMLNVKSKHSLLGVYACRRLLKILLSLTQLKILLSICLLQTSHKKGLLWQNQNQ